MSLYCKICVERDPCINCCGWPEMSPTMPRFVFKKKEKIVCHDGHDGKQTW